jgi:hypothetical protein
VCFVGRWERRNEFAQCFPETVPEDGLINEPSERESCINHTVYVSNGCGTDRKMSAGEQDYKALKLP